MIPEIPLWVGLGQVALYGAWSFLFSLVGMLVVMRAVLGKPGAVPAAEHWTETARRLWPARRAAGFGVFFLPFFAGIATMSARERAVAPAFVLVVSAFLAAIAGARLGNRRLGRAVSSPVSADWKYRSAGFLSMSLVMYLLVYAAVLFSWTMPDAFDWQGGLWLGLFAALTYTATRGIGLRLGLLLGVVRRAPPELVARVDALAAKIGHPPVPVYVIRTPMLNAFALPKMPAVAVTDALLAHMTPTEVDLICAHELGHITEAASVKNVRAALVWLVFVVMAGIFVMRVLKVDALAQVGVIFAIVYAKLLLAGKFLRNQEARADAVAHGHQEEEGLYARALETLYRLNGIPAVLAGRGKTHPHLYDRMLAAGVTPEYPRPAPPGGRRGAVAVVAVMGAAFVSMVLFLALPSHLNPGPRSERPEILAKMILTGPTAHNLSMLARLAYDAADYAPAGRLYARAARLSRRDPLPSLNAALAFAMGNECREARHWFRMATARLPAPGDEEEDDYQSFSKEFVQDVESSLATCRDVAH